MASRADELTFYDEMYRIYINFLHFETEIYETIKRVLSTMDRSQIISFSVVGAHIRSCKRNISINIFFIILI